MKNTSTMTMHEGAQKDSRAAFAAQLRSLETAEREGAANYGEILMDTAKMFSLCVLKKLAMQGAHVEIMNALRRDIMSGEGEGCDLQQAAALAILDECAKAHSREGAALPENWTEKAYTVRRASKRVLISADDSAAAKEYETCAAREIFRAVRAEIEKSRGIQIASLKYCYIADFADENGEGAEEAVYRRLPKYHSAVNADGTADAATFDSIEEAATALQLTAKQAAVLALRLKGYGKKAIATYHGITQHAIAKTLQQIQRKAIAAGLDKSAALYFAIAEKETAAADTAQPQQDSRAADTAAAQRSNTYTRREWNMAAAFDDYQ